MKFGGKSFNGSEHKKTGVQPTLKCKYCNREYKMNWARENHERLCREHFR